MFGAGNPVRDAHILRKSEDSSKSGRKSQRTLGEEL